MLGTSARPEGITNPPIDDLLEKVDSKYGLVVEAAKRARQINTYIRQLEENRFEFFPPLVDTEPEEKPLSIALREVAADKLQVISGEDARARRAAAEEDADIDAALNSLLDGTLGWADGLEPGDEASAGSDDEPEDPEAHNPQAETN